MPDLVANEIVKQIFLVDLHALKVIFLDAVGQFGELVVIFLEEDYFLFAIVGVDIGIDHDFFQPGPASGIALKIIERFESSQIGFLE